MNFRAFGVAVAIGGLVLQLGFHSAPAAESSEVAEAFSRLDALAEELAGWQRSIGQAGAASATVPTPPTAAVPAPAAPQPEATEGVRSGQDDGVQGLAAGTRGSSAPCGSRQEMAETIEALLERYEGHGRAIIEVNDKLPWFRRAVLDMEHICTERLANDVASVLTRLEGLDLAADYQVVDRLTTCVDRLRRETDDELSATKSSIRMKRLAAEMERLGLMTHRVADMERALLRAISKRDRLVYAFGQFQEEMEAVCQ